MDSRNLKLDTPYYLIENDDGTINGKWGGLEKGYSNPNYSVQWYNPNELDNNSAVIFSYTPVPDDTNNTTLNNVNSAISPIIGGMAGDQIIVSNLSGFISIYSPTFINVSGFHKQRVLLASAGVSDVGYSESIAPMSNKSFVWLMPIYMQINANDLGFDSNSYGFTLGIGKKFNNSFGTEIYAGYLNNNIDFDIKGADKEDQDFYFGGLNIIYSPKPYFAKFMILGFKADHDYTGYTGLNYELVEKADYDSYGIRFDLTGGYVFGKRTRFIPQVGLSYAYYNTDDFWTDVPSNQNLIRRYESENLNIFKFIAGADLISDLKTSGKTGVSIFGGLKIEQAVSNNDISTINYAPNQPKYKLEKEISNTTSILNAGVVFKYGKNWSFDISGAYNFNSDYQAFTGKAILKYKF